MSKRKLTIAVISDVHLGTYGCHARELDLYLKSIEPELLVINGDFIDGWQFSKRYFPASHTRVLQRILKMMAAGTRVVYVTGNHDEMLRQYSGFSIGNFSIEDKLVLHIEGKSFWFFHGDVFDLTMRHAKLIAKLGGFGYDLLILANRFANQVLQRFGRERYSFSKSVKDSVKLALKHINRFETTVADIAIENGYDYVVCGHIHEPVVKTFANQRGCVTYLNSGDWVENLTALEYHERRWSINRFNEAELGESEFPEPIGIGGTLDITAVTARIVQLSAQGSRTVNFVPSPATVSTSMVP